MIFICINMLIGQIFIFSFFSLFNHGKLTSEQLISIDISALIIPILYYVLLGRFYTIKVEDKNLFYKRFISKGQIDLSQLVSVDYFIIPYRFFFNKAYSISLTFTLPDNKNKKLTFLSTELSNMQEISDSIEYCFFKNLIDKKNEKIVNETND